MRNIGILFFLFSIIFLVFLVPEIGEDIQTNALLGEDYNTDEAKYFPNLVGVIILIISIFMIIQGGAKKDKNKLIHLPEINLTKSKDVGTLLLISLLYVVLLEPFGFFIMTPICVVASLLYFEIKKWFVLIVTPILTTVFIFLCFEMLMGIQLPKGILEWMSY